MSDDLVKRLRDVGRDYDFHENALVYEAADEIERLRKERDHEKERADILCDAIRYAVEVKRNYKNDAMIWLDDWFYGDPDAMPELDKWRANRAALRAAQEKEREYREALEPFARLADRYDPDDGDDDHAVWSKTAMPTIGQLRRARAALKGGE